MPASCSTDDPSHNGTKGPSVVLIQPLPSDAGRIFSDMKLELRTATLSGGQFVLGLSALPQIGLSSDATLDNVEHLYFDASSAGGDLPVGSYAFLITGDPSRISTIGFSYDAIAPVRSRPH